MTGLEILLNLGRSRSSSSNLNYFAKFGPVHIMDNHLAAIWSWEHLGLESFTLVHIDAHYDLAFYPRDNGKKFIKGDLKTIPVNRLTELKQDTLGCPYFLWDNYIQLFNIKYPGVITRMVSITQELGNFELLENVTIEEFDLQHLESPEFFTESESMILNLDVDYFFNQLVKQEVRKPNWTQVAWFCSWFTQNWERFEQIVIALSPECCGSWQSSIDVANHILNGVGIKVEI